MASSRKRIRRARVSIDRALVASLQKRLDENPRSSLRVAAALRTTEFEIELLAPGRGEEAEAAALLRAFRPAAAARRADASFWRAYDSRTYPRPTLDLGLEMDGGCIAALLVGREAMHVDEIHLVGPRMERWLPAQGPPVPAQALSPTARHSRYAGALGGADALNRLQSLRVGVVGCARLGSVAAMSLARAGVRELKLVDADVLEEHSIDAVEVDPTAIGRAKVDAVRDLLARSTDRSCVTPIRARIESGRALEAAAACDVLISAPDDNRARLTTALLAAAYARPHLDIGAGVFGADDAWEAGADVRMCLPRQRCLYCFGGLDLRPRPRDRDWRLQRAGSLRSLNQCAVGQAMLLLERFVVGDLTSSTWMRLRVERDGRLGTTSMVAPARATCPVCSVFAGAGDAAFTARLLSGFAS